MKCPNCGNKFGLLVANGSIPDFCPMLCDGCIQVCLLVNGVPRKATDEELSELKKSDAWRDMIGPAIEIMKRQKKARKAQYN